MREDNRQLWDINIGFCRSQMYVCEKTTRRRGVWLIHQGQGRFIRTELRSSGTIQPSTVQGHLGLIIRGYWCLSRDGESRLKVRGLEWIRAGDVLVLVPFRFFGHPRSKPSI